MNSLYFDYNSTAPLAESVKAHLAKGVFFEANASSTHHLGKQALKQVHQTTQTISDLFNLDDHEVIYTSGATEGLNWVISSFALDHKDKGFLFVCFQSDHSVALEQEEFVNKMGGEFIAVPVLQSGAPDLLAFEETLKKNNKKKILVNWTWVNNETGVVWKLDLLDKYKDQYDFIVHVDAPQSVFKLKDFNQLNPSLEMYSYSGHKFGALKGIGFSLIKKNLKLSPILKGGSQQNGRAGTMNTLGIYSLHLALNEYQKVFNPTKQQDAIDFLRRELAQFGTLLGSGDLNLNTINMALKKTKSQLALIKFDLANIAISSGSACNSGSFKPSHVIKAMGHDELADQALRFSFEWDLNLDKVKMYAEKIKAICQELEG